MAHFTGHEEPPQITMRTPKLISKINKTLKEMDDINLILYVEKHRELYDPQQKKIKDNVEKYQCWDIANAMFMYHVSEKGKL